MNATSKRVFRIAAAIGALMGALPAFADVSEATHKIVLNAPLDPVPLESVHVYTYRPNQPLKPVGLIFARGMAGTEVGSLDLLGKIDQALSAPPTEQDDIDLAMRALYADAAAIGANGLIITKSEQVQVRQNASERRITAIAFRILAP
jgi:hypothetical protein